MNYQPKEEVLQGIHGEIHVGISEENGLPLVHVVAVEPRGMHVFRDVLYAEDINVGYVNTSKRLAYEALAKFAFTGRHSL